MSGHGEPAVRQGKSSRNLASVCVECAMKLTVNGDDREMPGETRLPDLLADLGLGDQPCAVEVNGRVVPKREHGGCLLGEGDVIENVTLVGGG